MESRGLCIEQTFSTASLFRGMLPVVQFERLDQRYILLPAKWNDSWIANMKKIPNRTISKLFDPLDAVIIVELIFIALFQMFWISIMVWKAQLLNQSVEYWRSATKRFPWSFLALTDLRESLILLRYIAVLRPEWEEQMNVVRVPGLIGW